MEKIDLHIHTNISDGTLSPEEVVKKAKEINCQKISITDHDIANSYEELERKYDIEIIPGIEFNTADRNLHILGYGMLDINSINERMTELRLLNEKVCLKVIDLMEKAGYDISLEKLLIYLRESNFNTEIIDKRKIVKYLIYMGYANNVLDAYESLIGREQEFYVPNYKISPQEIIKLIKDCGGIAVLAHPSTISKNPEEVINKIKELKEFGLDGIEIQNGKIDLINNDIYQKLAEELNLVKTVGSDFHDPAYDHIGVETEEKTYKEFYKRLVKKR